VSNLQKEAAKIQTKTMPKKFFLKKLKNFLFLYREFLDIDEQ